ncbi:hypothetical protein TKWG_09195 [Advenella kashmirensis WT001]|uniref:Uncharacterized protein n=1 Tax=Advenella kashmirensis (strain DSM 17095 / LMG 22695 / WT001) TaxID=1036672 RepID=I3UAX7_ADVKW|nr:hypothetical protein [Advenella kashmirensis]AFK62165.1 hypothetical protein TKWG_09195 [Advenella kashmirensis WT001]
MINSSDMLVQILYKWDEASKQTANYRPINSTAALLTWDVVPLPIDEGVPEPIMRAVAETMAASGTVAFRLFFNVRSARWPDVASRTPSLVPQESRGESAALLACNYCDCNNSSCCNRDIFSELALTGPGGIGAS